MVLLRRSKGEARAAALTEATAAGRVVQRAAASARVPLRRRRGRIHDLWVDGIGVDRSMSRRCLGFARLVSVEPGRGIHRSSIAKR